jgi:hypothetical protein
MTAKGMRSHKSIATQLRTVGVEADLMTTDILLVPYQEGTKSFL